MPGRGRAANDGGQDAGWARQSVLMARRRAGQLQAVHFTNTAPSSTLAACSLHLQLPTGRRAYEDWAVESSASELSVVPLCNARLAAVAGGGAVRELWAACRGLIQDATCRASDGRAGMWLPCRCITAWPATTAPRAFVRCCCRALIAPCWKDLPCSLFAESHLPGQHRAPPC